MTLNAQKQGSHKSQEKAGAKRVTDDGLEERANKGTVCDSTEVSRAELTCVQATNTHDREGEASQPANLPAYLPPDDISKLQTSLWEVDNEGCTSLNNRPWRGEAPFYAFPQYFPCRKRKNISPRTYLDVAFSPSF
jgi:hypothetical protein